VSDDLFHHRAPERIERIGLVLGVMGTIALFSTQGLHSGIGFLCGAAISLVNFRWWKSLASQLGVTHSVPMRGSAVILGLRYLLIGAAIYAIVKYLEINLVAILLGLFVSVAAVIFEILYELIYAGT